MKKQKPKIHKNHIELFKIFPFETHIVVVCAGSHEEVLSLLNDKKNKEISDFIYSCVNEFTIEGTDIGAVVSHPTTEKPIIIYLKNRERDNDFFITLMHETHHVVYKLSKQFSFVDEPEFQAYMHGYLYNQFYKIYNK